MRESFSVLPAEDLCCAGAHHQELATVPIPQLFAAALLTCSAVILRRPALCKSEKHLEIMFQQLWFRVPSESRINRRKLTAWQEKRYQSWGKATVPWWLPAWCAGLWACKFWKEGTLNFSRPVTKSILKACTVLIHAPALPVWVAGWPCAGCCSGV